MTTTDIDTLTGRDLDRAIAEEVFGAETLLDGYGMSIMRQSSQPHHLPVVVPQYSSNIASAWLVMEAMRESGYWASIDRGPNSRDWCASFQNNNSKYIVYAPAAPLAICGAAIKAKRAEKAK